MTLIDAGVVHRKALASRKTASTGEAPEHEHEHEHEQGHEQGQGPGQDNEYLIAPALPG